MEEFDKSLEDIENSINNIHTNQKAYMKNNKSKYNYKTYLYIIGILIPIISILILYFYKPKMVMNKRKGKRRLCMRKLIMTVFLITIISWSILYLIYYLNLF
jgi:hypothetical protein